MQENTQPTIDAKGEELRKRHQCKAVYRIDQIGENGEPLVGYIRKPNIDEIGAFVSLGQNNPVQAAKVLLNSTWLEGDRVILEDEELFLGVMAVLDSIVKVRIAKVVKI